MGVPRAWLSLLCQLRGQSHNRATWELLEMETELDECWCNCEEDSRLFEDQYQCLQGSSAFHKCEESRALRCAVSVRTSRPLAHEAAATPRRHLDQPTMISESPGVQSPD